MRGQDAGAYGSKLAAGGGGAAEIGAGAAGSLVAVRPVERQPGLTRMKKSGTTWQAATMAMIFRRFMIIR